MTVSVGVQLLGDLIGQHLDLDDQGPQLRTRLDQDVTEWKNAEAG